MLYSFSSLFNTNGIFLMPQAPTHDQVLVLQASRNVLTTVRIIFWSLTTISFYESEVTQSCPTLCVPMDCSLPGFSIRGIFQARVLEWIALSFSRRSSWTRDQTQVSCIAGKCFTALLSETPFYEQPSSLTWFTTRVSFFFFWLNYVVCR